MVFLKPAYTERFKSGISQTKQNINKYEPNLRISFKVNMVNIGYISNSEKKGRKNCRTVALGTFKLYREICYRQF